MFSAIPRLAPTIVQRPRLQEWLGRFKSVPVRFVIAPPGFGKTVALLNYLREAPSGYYAPLAPEANEAAVWASIAGALEAETPSSHDALVRELAARAPLELALDCDAVPDATGLAAILKLIESVPDDVSLLIACRSRAAFEVGRFVMRGMATLCDAERLAFALDEIRHLAETCGVRFVHADLARLLQVSDGWPLVVSSVIRKAAEDSRSLYEAFDNWRGRHGHLFNDLIGAAMATAPEHQAELVRKLTTGSLPKDYRELEELEEQGLFVIHSPEGYRPLRALSLSRLYDRYAGNALPAAPMHVRLLGWFQAEVERRPIQWIRRRDLRIFEYVALKSGGSVSREELAQVFWPGVQKHLVAQSLRTACSNIRKAIGHVVGFDRVGDYFRANGELSIDLDNVIVDVKDFLAHATDGDQQFERGDIRAALRHYQAAEELYTGSLLIGEMREPWVDAQAVELERRHNIMVERLASIGSTRDRRRAGSPAAQLAAGA